MREKILEEIIELGLLYLRLPENSGESIGVWTGRHCPSDPVLNAVIFREELWAKLKELSQQIHRL